MILLTVVNSQDQRIKKLSSFLGDNLPTSRFFGLPHLSFDTPLLRSSLLCSIPMSGRNISYGRGGAGKGTPQDLTSPFTHHVAHRQHNPPTECALPERFRHPHDQTGSLHNRPRRLREHDAQRPRPAGDRAREPGRRVPAPARATDSPPHRPRYVSDEQGCTM